MSTGGTFKLIANDGKADRLIMATALLNQRIQDVGCARRMAGKHDTTPTLADLERTHVLHMNAHYKPFAALGYEYNKVKPNTGCPQLGNSVTFSIPQFGDFFYDMVGHQVLSSCSSSLQSTPAQGTMQIGAYGRTQSFPANGVDWDNQTPLPGSVYSLVLPTGAAATPNTPNAYRNLVGYCTYPGERIYNLVKFEVNGNPLDEYSSDTICLLRKFTIGKDLIDGYKQLVGQEVPVEGYSGPNFNRMYDTHQKVPAAVHLTDANEDTSNAPVPQTPEKFITSNFPENAYEMGAAGNAAPTNGSAPIYYDVQRDYVRSVRGPQTPKLWQPALEIWNKLRFWFNDDARLSVPSVSIPFGQRYITIDLARQEQIVTEHPGLFVRQVVTTTDTSGNTTRVVRHRPWHVSGRISEIGISQMELYVNNIFVNPEVHDIYIKRVGFSLIRVFRRHTQRCNSDGQDERHLSQLKWPIEYMFVGLRPAWNTNSMNPDQHRDWHQYCRTFNVEADKPYLSNSSGSAGALISEVHSIMPTVYAVEAPTIDTLSINSHGITLHDNFPSTFFNSYNPFHYGGTSIVTPRDRGALMINFALHPRSYQPSGHLNISRAREFYMSWNSGYVSPNTPADLVVIGVALNFLLITDGSAVLRYST